MQLSIGTSAFGAADPAQLSEYVQQAEQLGVASVWSAEAWGTDAVTPIAFLAARTTRIKLGTGILQVGARSPAMIAMTALTLATYTNNRFMLGLGVSGPQVIEGLHGISYAGPLTRMRETVEIVRMACRGERLIYDGRYHTLPRPGGEGKALRIDRPATPVPIFLATLGPRALEYTGAAADGWLGTSFSPDHAEAHLAHIRKGAASAGRPLEAIRLHVACAVAIGEDVESMVNARKPAVAFSMGAMGSARTNFYNEAFQRAGFVDDARAIQSLWLAGKREAAAQRVPDEMVTQFGAIGTPEMIRDRLNRYRAVGIDCLNVRIDAKDPRHRIEQLEQLTDIVAQP